MKIPKINHIGVATKNVDETVKLYRDVLKLKVEAVDVVQELGLKIGFVRVGEVGIELLEPLSPDSAVGKFLAERGEGIHHICYEVENIEQAIADAKAGGARMIDEKPRKGYHGNLVAFIHPKSCSGVLTELCQPVHP
jgi:methylmalonyl-CoA/ethylmalonyl-CoA epimerase